MSFMKDFDYLKIQMKDILSATRDFDPTMVIGGGGFGTVYKGKLSSRKGKIMAAFKKLDRRHGQGNIEFWKEVMTLSEYKHENLISLMHYCIEGDASILVYEYASRRSLDRYLSDASTLDWIQRLKICVGAAHGLLFLHDPKQTQQRVLHRDIKSSNILLDENWTAKISDFGLSKVGPANQERTYLASHGVGTPGYCDPLYLVFGLLTKESDVYSFGVVLFEVLCGKLCYEFHNHEYSRIFVPEWIQCYDENRLDEIILPGLKEQMDPCSLKSFVDIAYRCVKKTREERPTMAEIEIKLMDDKIRALQVSDRHLEPYMPESTHRGRNKRMLKFNVHHSVDNFHVKFKSKYGYYGDGYSQTPPFSQEDGPSNPDSQKDDSYDPEDEDDEGIEQLNAQPGNALSTYGFPMHGTSPYSFQWDYTSEDGNWKYKMSWKP